MSDSEVKVWFVQCKPFEPGKRTSKDSTDFQKDCVDKGMFGMGWRPDVDCIKERYGEERSQEVAEKLEKLHGKEYSSEVAEELKKLLRVQFDRFPGRFTEAQKYYSKMEEGHVVFVCLNKIYYAGIIKFKPIISDHKRLTWYSEVKNGWIKIGENVDLPHHVRGLISGKRYWGTVAPVEQHLSADTIKKIAGIECPKIKLNKDNFFYALGDEDLEDIAADYMTQKNKGYIFLPSSCKKGTPGIEYVLYNPENGKQITCQVKVDCEIDLGNYLNDSYAKYEKIYFFSGKGENEGEGYVNKPENMRNLEIISRQDLYETLKNNAYFSEIIRQYFDFE